MFNEKLPTFSQTPIVDLEEEITKKYRQLLQIVWVDKYSSRILFEIDYDVCAANTIPTLHYYLEQNSIVKSLSLPSRLSQTPLRILFTSSLDCDTNGLYATCLSGNLLTLKSGTALPVKIHAADNGNRFNELWNGLRRSTYKIPSLEQKDLVAVDTAKISENYDIIIINVERFLGKYRPESLRKLTKSLTENQIFIAMTSHPTCGYTYVKTLKNLFFHLGGFDFQPLKSLKAKWWLFCKHNGYHFAEIIKWGCLQYLQLNMNEI
ncbi:unnamed protein product [Hymenolepis diminuta]|uniref:Uncharacterized protein n=1 Tax=Hymenolepis diminuta TaxID=6216 RepID=A0A0R3SA12_HYMDI|nr:unnamed protein product [Hymenolepis diminuta]VUZ46595.1 unnamed protein product [Hymenolepis diminuta]